MNTKIIFWLVAAASLSIVSIAKAQPKKVPLVGLI